MPIVQIATNSGHAVITLNEGFLGCNFYVGDKIIRGFYIRIQNEKAVFDDGWRMDILLWLLEYEPTVDFP
jgi:hypothetical protein